MKKLTRQARTAGVCAAFVAGAVLSAGGSAAAATGRPSAPAPARTAVTGAAPAASFSVHHFHHPRHHHLADPRTDPWVAGQLATFGLTADKRSAVYDPWVKDQIALFGPSGR
ncbi:hypothetical protein [Streptomyces similanensis]|uniref:Uncharacterized protein n=1 Tax=Streptomyces similanensis TaxID=1274988 RepID=A0ABP9JU54_9ACTN